MGAYLSEPVTTKESADGFGKNVAFGASSMQGWRVSQEDAHNCCSDFDEDVALFAVYDGHGGHEVASYCAKKLPEFIKQTEAYKRGDVRQALIDAFLGFDATLATPEVIQVLKEISKSVGDANKTEEEAETDDDDNVSNLKQEAAMPLEQVIAKYMEAPGDRFGKKIISSPNIRCRRTKERDPAAGCSSTWTNEADVSSSSVPASASEVSSPGKDPEAQQNCKEGEAAKNSEAEQILDSTTGAAVNGEVDHKTLDEPAVKTKGEIKESKAEMPDSSEDSDTKVSPSKAEKDKEVNGSDVKDKAEGKNNDVTSSSTLENGETSQEGATAGRRRISAPAGSLFRGLLPDSDEDDEDDNDESFDVPESGSDTDELGSEVSDEDDSEDDEYSFEDDEGDDPQEGYSLNEEPGSDSGCTAVVAVLRGDDLFVANAGDSRCVLCRDGQALELSLDHKPEDELEMKRINEAGGKVTADGRVNGGLNLSRALGDHSYKQNSQLPAEKQMISAMPDVRHVKIDTLRDEFFILACDGIWNFMSSADVVKFVKERIDNTTNLSTICEELFDHCLAPDTHGDGTGCDNMTAVIVKLKAKADSEDQKTSNNAAKKRPLSPPASEQNPASEQSNECKRIKEDSV